MKIVIEWKKKDIIEKKYKNIYNKTMFTRSKIYKDAQHV